MNENAISFLQRHGMDPASIDFAACLEGFRAQMNAGLQGLPGSLPMIPTYVSPGRQVPQDVPVIVLDAGGTNLRVGLCSLHGADAKVSRCLTMPMPGTLRPLSREEFLNQIADLVMPLLESSDHIGYCFSFPAEITPDLDGICAGFNKEIHVSDDKGMRVCAELCEALAARGCKTPVYALINDTVAALLGGYGSVDTGAYDGFIGFILGTGVNCCYTESAEKITKLPGLAPGSSMVVNMEAGCYDSFPMGDFDRNVDARSAIPNDHLYEKMVSGAYFGEIA